MKKTISAAELAEVYGNTLENPKFRVVLADGTRVLIGVREAEAEDFVAARPLEQLRVERIKTIPEILADFGENVTVEWNGFVVTP